MKGIKTIAEYAILKWMEQEGFVRECFSIEFNGNEAVITDSENCTMKLIYHRKQGQCFRPERRG